MKFLNSLILLIAVTLIASWTVFAGPPPGKGRGGGHGAGHGRVADDFRGVIHSLFAAHDKFERSVKLTKEGYQARTVSDDPELAKRLQKHVAQMAERLDGGMSVRHWDPAFAEMREHYDDMEVSLKNIAGGVEVTVVGKTPEAIKVARNHAVIVSGFVEKGESQRHATHATALGGKPSRADGDPKK